MIDTNPYRLDPAGDYFVGRKDLLDGWRARLSSTEEVRNWLVLASGGLGKTSLLLKFQQIAQQEFKALTIAADFGAYRDHNNPTAFFETIENQLAAAPDLGSIARKLFQLTPNSSDASIVLHSAINLLKVSGLSISVNPVLGISPSLPDPTPNNTEDIAVRTARFQQALLAVSKRLKRPIVIFIDQLGKAYDSPLWCDIAKLMLSSMLQLRKDGMNRLIFVVAMRPERYGLLDAQIQQQELFGDFLFQRHYLKPFSEEEAERAICTRNQGHILGPIPPDLAKAIIHEVSFSGSLDPYAVIQASAAVWAYLYGEQPRCPTNLSEQDIHNAITNYYINLIHYFQHSTSLWAVLKELTFSGSLTINDIVDRINYTRHKTITSEVERAIDNLLYQRGYQIVSVQSQPDGSPRYSIAHELLREALLKQIPEGQRLEAQAQKTLQDALWRWKHQADILSERELSIIYQYRHVLQLTSIAWEAIAATLLNAWKVNYTVWLTYDINRLDKAIQRYLRGKVKPKAATRGSMILAYHSNDRDLWRKTMGYIADHGVEILDRILSIQAIARLGDSEHAHKMLLYLAYNAPNMDVRREAAEGLAGIGDIETACRVLVDLACNASSGTVRSRALDGLVRTGDTQITCQLLADLARNAPDSTIRTLAIADLAEAGEPAGKMLADLACNAPDDEVRWRAVQELPRVGETALELLGELAHNDTNRLVRMFAAEGLREIGIPAIEILSDLARNASEKDIREQAVKGLPSIGKPAYKALADLASNASEESVREQATEGLSRIEKPALEVLEDVARDDWSKAVRKKAIEELAKVGQPACKIMLNLAENAPDLDVRLLAIQELARVGDTQVAFDKIADLIHNDPEKFDRWQVSKWLAQAGEPAYELLTELAHNDTEEYVRQQATEGLAKIGEPACKVLADIARNERSGYVRWHAAVGLARIGEPAREVLLDLVHSDPDEDVRWQAAEGLAELGLKSYFFALVLNSPLGPLPEYFYEEFIPAFEQSINDK